MIKVNDDIELKFHEVEYAEQIYALVDKDRQRLRQWLPWVDITKSPEDSRKYIEASIHKRELGIGLGYGIWYKGELAGAISLQNIDKQHFLAEIGYWLGVEFEGKGIVTQSAKALLSYGFNELQLNRIVIMCAVGNDKSCAIPKRLGFTHEGILREAEYLYDHFVDLNVFSLLKREFK